MIVDTEKGVAGSGVGPLRGMLSSSYDECPKADGKVVAPKVHLERTGESGRSPKTISVSQIEDDGENKYRAGHTKQEFWDNYERNAVVKKESGDKTA